MAISPAYSVRSPASKSQAEGRSKTLAILNNSKKATSPLNPSVANPGIDSGLDLSEKRNDETRQKYVKGISYSSYVPTTLTDKLTLSKGKN